MSTTMHSTTIFTPRGTACPKIVTQDYLNADPEIHPIVAEIALANAATMPKDDGWCYAVLMQVVEAIRDGGGVIVSYRNEEGEVSARCWFPAAVTVTAGRHLVARCYCTARRETRSFRLDRVLDCHALTLPCDARPPLPEVAWLPRDGSYGIGTLATVGARL